MYKDTQNIIGSLCRFEVYPDGELCLAEIMSEDQAFFLFGVSTPSLITLLPIEGRLKNKLTSLVDEVSDCKILMSSFTINNHDAPPIKYSVMGFIYDEALKLDKSHKDFIGLIFFNKSDIDANSTSDIINSIDVNKIDFFAIIKKVGVKRLITLIMVLMLMDIYITGPIKEVIIKNKEVLLEKIFF